MVVTVFRPRLHYKGARAQKLHRKQKFRQNSEFFPPRRDFSPPAWQRPRAGLSCRRTLRSVGCIPGENPYNIPAREVQAMDQTRTGARRRACRTSRTARCCGTARSMGCSRSRSTRTKSEQKTAKASPRGDAFAAVSDALRDAGDLIVLGLDRALEHGVVHRGAERHDGGARRVADLGLGDFRQRLECLFTVASQ